MRSWTRAQQRRYKEIHRKAQDVAEKLLGGYSYNCSMCGKDYKSKWPETSYPCCDDCFPF